MSLFHLDKKSKQFAEFKKTFLIKESNEIKNFFIASFRNQGFTDKSLEAWKQVKRRIEGTKEYKYPKTKGLGRRTRAINVGTGRTRKSIMVKSVSKNKLVVGSVGVDYAKYVNESRPFIGKSEVLRVKLKNKLKTQMGKILKGK
jgi:hypothetical protein